MNTNSNKTLKSLFLLIFYFAFVVFAIANDKNMSCSNPTGLTVVSTTDNSAIISWSSSSSATSFDVELRESSKDNNWPIKYPNVIGTTFTINQLSSCTYYEFRIRANCGAEKSDFVMSGTSDYKYLYIITTGVCTPEWPVTNGTITGNFGEVHPTNNDHFHGAFDISRTTGLSYKAVLSGKITDTDPPTLEHSGMNSKQTIYRHCNADNVNLNQIVKKGNEIGKVSASNHVHLEMQQYDNGLWYYINPCHNDYGWELSKPNDVTKPEIADIFIQPIDANSGYKVIGTSANITEVQSKLKIHYRDATCYGGDSPPCSTHAVEFNKDNDKFLVFGKIGTLLKAHDLDINGGGGCSLSFTKSSLSVDNILKYQLDFDKFATSDYKKYESVYHPSLSTCPHFFLDSTNPNCGPWTIGVEDIIELRHLTSESDTYTDIHDIHDNDGIWDTKLGSCGEGDGKHILKFRIEDFSNNSDEAEIPIIVDNFKPYIKSVTITANGKSYTRNVECSTCGIQLGAAVGDPFTSADLANGFKVSVTTSEPMNTLQLTVTAAGVSQTTSVLSADKQNYVFNIPANGNLQSSGKVALSFNGTDMADNQILNFANTSGCKALPIRTGTNSWTSTTLGSGTETSFSFPICNEQLFAPIIWEIVPASDCSTPNGKIKVIPTGSAAGLTFEWFWFKGGTWELIGNGINPAALQSLQSGEYKVVTTNTLGCRGEEKLSVTSPNDITVKFTALRPCIGLSNGSLTIDVTSKNTNGYDIVVSGGTLNSSVKVLGKASSTISNLGIGKYYVFIQKAGVTNDPCARIFEYDLNVSNFTSSDITATVNHPCKFRTNGRITLDNSKFGVPHTIKWETPIPVSKQSWNNPGDLSTGIYTVDVTNQCGQKAIKSFELIEIDHKVSLNAVLNSDCTSDIVASSTSINLPIKYSFDNVSLGIVSDNKVKNIKGSGGTISVKATDSNGCIANQSLLVETPYYTLGGLAACAGATGLLGIWVHNPNNDILSVKAFGFPVPMTMAKYDPKVNPTAHHQYYADPAIANLSAGTIIPVEISIGNSCKGVEMFTVPSKPLTKKFDKYVGDETKGYKCLYTQYCNDMIYKDAEGNAILHEEPAEIGENIEYNTGWFGQKKRCKNIVTCPDPYDKTKKVFSTEVGKTKMKTGSTGEFIAFLENEKKRVPANSSFIDGIIKSIITQIYMDILFPPNQFDSLNATPPKSMCTKLRWCPTNYSWSYAIGTISVKINIGLTFADTTKPKLVGACFEYTCGSIKEKACPTDPKAPVIIVPTVDNCNPTTLPSLQLYMWYNDLMTDPKYSNFKTSELKKFLDDNKNDERVNCTKITYCQKDFSVINYPNLSKIECVKSSGLSIKYVETCKLLKTETGQPVVYCFTGWGNSSKTSFYYTPYFLDPNPKYNPNFIGIPNTNKVVLNNLENTEFNGFSYGKDNNTLASFGVNLENYQNQYIPLGIFRGEQSSANFNFANVGGYQNLVNIGDEVFNIYDTDINEEISVTNVINSKLYALDYTKGEEVEWLANIQAEKGIKIENVHKNSKSIKLVGHFQGTLNYNLKEIATSENAAFALILDYDGNLTGSHVIENIDSTNFIFYEDETATNLVGTMLNDQIKSNGIFIGSDKNSIFDIDIINNKIINALPFAGNVKINKFAKDKKLDRSYYLLSAEDNNKEDAKVANISIKSNELLLLAVNGNGVVEWNQKITSLDFKEGYFDFILDEKGSLYVGATFNEYISMDDIEVTSNGGSDIFLVKLDSEGKISGYRHFGSTDDENVKKIAKNFDGLTFGGEVYGETKERTIGDVDFIISGYVDHEAYTSSVWDKDFKEGKIGTKISKPNASSAIKKVVNDEKQNINVNIYPNPFSSNLFVSVNSSGNVGYTLRLIDVLGREIWKQESESPKNATTHEINTATKLEKGVYFIEVKGSNGIISLHKIVKQ
jgi:hypothetical protein